MFIKAACGLKLPLVQISAESIKNYDRQPMTSKAVELKSAYNSTLSAHCGPQNENLGANLRIWIFRPQRLFSILKKRYLAVIDVPDQMVTPAGV